VLVRALLAALVLSAALPGATSASSSPARLTVFAAASLREALPAVDARARYDFAGSDQLAVQIEQGAPADVFAGASPKYPELLYREGLVQKPIPFVTNTLVLIVPKGNPAGIHRVGDLTRPGVKLVIGDASVPVGSYTRTVLDNLGISAAVMKNVVSQETDVKGVVGKVALGEADAGFVYATDVRPVLGKVGVIRIRESAQPHVVYEVAIVKRTTHLREAYTYVTRLLRRPAQRVFVEYGFGRRPAPQRKTR
jgi:molybdate transport system substrate-binding protein